RAGKLPRWSPRFCTEAKNRNLKILDGNKLNKNSGMLDIPEFLLRTSDARPYKYAPCSWLSLWESCQPEGLTERVK
ncbi:MAG: hypothetical protein IJZ15_00675, partial [Oscillospiraceae bacterium]|nr:hypothetical protein [Oscillospiraceae bacterium]